jgi:hypothetical protein
MNFKISLAVRNARLAVIRDALDADTNPGYIEFYTAPQPANGGAAITTQTKLGTCILSKPSGTVANGSLTLSTVADDLAADATGDIAWARLYDGAGTFVADGDVGDPNSSALIKFNTISALQGGLIKITSGELVEGNA